MSNDGMGNGVHQILDKLPTADTEFVSVNSSEVPYHQAGNWRRESPWFVIVFLRLPYPGQAERKKKLTGFSRTFTHHFQSMHIIDE